MIIGKYDTKDLIFIGFYDSCLFRQNDDSSGYVFKDKNGRKIFISKGEFKKAMKEGKNDIIITS